MYSEILEESMQIYKQALSLSLSIWLKITYLDFIKYESIWPCLWVGTKQTNKATMVNSTSWIQVVLQSWKYYSRDGFQGWWLPYMSLAENSEFFYYFVRRHQLVRMQFLSQIFISIEMKLYILLMAQFHQYVLYRKVLKHLKSFWCNISKQGNYCNLTQVLKEFRYLISWVCTKMIIYE